MFFDGSFGHVSFEAPADFRGGATPIEVVATPAPTGHLTIKLDPSLSLPEGKFMLILEEARDARRSSANRIYVNMALPVDGGWDLHGLVTGDYQCRLMVGNAIVANAFVSVSTYGGTTWLRERSRRRSR